MSDEEDDYMSDAILQQCGDTRPGLVSRAAKRKLEHAHKIKKNDESNNTKPKKVLEAEKREEGLQSAIGSDNKGFALLAKMGYKPGMGLGKEGRKGRTEPVSVEIKDGRKGLGHASEIKRLRAEAIVMRQEMLKKRHKLNDQYQQDFRSRQRGMQMEKELERDLSKSQNVCCQLDTREGIKCPVQSFYWTAAALANAQSPVDQSESEDEYGDVILAQKRLKADDSNVDDCKSEEEAEEDEILEECDFTNSEKLQMLTSYLRGTYLYCVWCGTQYDDYEDLKSNCPGDTSSDHND